MKKRSIRWISTVAIMSALASIVMIFEISLGFAPDWYKIDVSEVVVLIGAFALGPLAGVVIEGIKIILHMFFVPSITMGVGEFANFLIGISLVLPASFFYHKRRTKKAAIVGLIVGVLTMIVIGSFLNAYVLLPLFAVVYEMPVNGLISFGTALNPRIVNMTSFILLAVVPFNLIKGTLVSVIVLISYKKVAYLIKGKDIEGE